MLRDEYQISVIADMEEKEMNRISRLTQTIIANGVAVIDKRFVLGKCQNFRIVNLTRMARENGFALNSLDMQYEEKFLMLFEGCNPALGCTILLSGHQNETSELRKLKKLMRKLLLTARSIYMEQFFLQLIRIEVPLLPNLSDVHLPDSVDSLSAVNDYFSETD
jgi:hypothetical protein